MANYIAIVFDSYAQASYAQEKLRELNRAGDITIHAAALVHRNAAGAYEVEDAVHLPGLRTVVGAALGGFIGALTAGAVGVGPGAYAGAVAGMAADTAKSGEHHEALDELELMLRPGEGAIVTEISEEKSSHLEATMQSLGGRIYRRSGEQLREEFFG